MVLQSLRYARFRGFTREHLCLAVTVISLFLNLKYKAATDKLNEV